MNKEFGIMKSKNILILLLICVFLISLYNSSAEESLLEKSNTYLKNVFGEDYFSTYIGEPIINNNVDPNWDSYDTEGAKQKLQITDLPPIKSIIIYPFNVDGSLSQFRVIIFEDEKIYSELNEAIPITIDKKRAIEIAEEKNIKSPYNVVLSTTDKFFGWIIKNSEMSDKMKEGEIIQVSINIKNGEVNTSIYKSLVYNKDNEKNTFFYFLGLGLIVIILIILVILYKGFKK